MSVSFFSRARILFLFFIAAVFCAEHLYSAPIEKGFDLAPPASASPEEKRATFREARLRVLAAAGKYEHTPYRYGGLDKRGLDCSGLVYLSFHDALGVSVPRNTWSLYSWVEKIKIEDAIPGDLVFFNTSGNGTVSHVGIFIGNGRFIHSASEGPATGVIYSSLDEQYWSRTYAGSGRVLPEADIRGTDAGSATAKNTTKSNTKKSNKGSNEGNLLFGVAAAPTWDFGYENDTILRGVAGQFRVGAEVKPFGISMIPGMELRLEWDRTLGVFRLPLTLSWGLSDKVRFFAGPTLSFGSPALTVSGEDRHYTGGTSWLGAAGITVAPLTLKVAKSYFSLYGELAWQSYFGDDNNDKNFSADLAASFRFSTGLRYTWRPLQN
jgi:probable lipoprotein NlpC